MKKRTCIVLILLLSATLSNAQGYTYDSLCHHYMGDYFVELYNILGLDDGDILVNLGLRTCDEQGSYNGDYGHVLLKLTQDENGLSIADSVVIEDNYITDGLMERDPRGKDYLYADIERDFDNLTAILHIRHFDDMLNFDGNDIQVVLEDTLFYYQNPWALNNELLNLQAEQFIIDGNDIVLSYALLTQDPFSQPPYVSPYVAVFARLGTDGTVKDKVVLADTLFDTSESLVGFGVFSESPREYYKAAVKSVDGQQVLEYCIVDSLFRFQRIERVGRNLGDNINATFNITQFLPFDDSTFVVASCYRYYSDVTKRGTFVSRYDKEGNLVLSNAFFPTDPANENLGCAYPLGIEKTEDGGIFLAYCTQDRTAGYVGWVGVAKLDADMNVVWRRYCLEPTGYIHECAGPMNTRILDDGRFVVGAVDYTRGVRYPSPFFLVFTDNGVGVSEQSIEIRPYCFFPNPVQSALHLQYSPDVTPTQIELYDLQGRLVRTQRKGLESLDMEGLASGTYTMRIMLEGGQTFSDKVMKE